MTKIRAYKLAEELGIERNEFVDKVRDAGFDLKNAMASLDEETVEQIRRKLGVAKSKGKFVEKRVAGKKGGAVIRRRKRKEEEPKPVEEVVEEPEPSEVIEELPTEEPIVEEVAAEEAVVEEKVAEETTKKPKVEDPKKETVASVATSAKKKVVTSPQPEMRVTKQRKRVREVVNLGEQEKLARQSLGRTGARHAGEVDSGGYVSPRRKRRDPLAPKRVVAVAKPESRIAKIDGDISVADLAKVLGIKAPAIQGKLMGLGIMVTVNQKIEFNIAEQIGKEYGFELQDVGFKEASVTDDPKMETGASSEAAALEPRPPIVTVMGHVDHGKTSLLDAIRETSVVTGEAGGITQHIGAYQAAVGDHRITFIDTPGHEAFTHMRARGAQLTDLVILVIAASDGPMPQTVEAINHAKAAGVPIIVAINKCDLPDADPDKTRQRLMEHELVPEEYGGDTICVEVSALKKTGLEKLLEMVLLQAEVLELKADPTLRASGVVIEAELDRGRGPLATVLIQSGTLRQGDIAVAGQHYGRVRTLENEHGQRLEEVGPATPVRLIGLSGVPGAGDVCHGVESERAAKQLVEHRGSKERDAVAAEPARPMSLDDLFAQSGQGELLELPIILKADVQGTAEAVREALMKLSTDAVAVKVIHIGIGGITESDVMLAKASNAIVVGFNVRPDPAARRASESHAIDVRVYKVIYELTDEIRLAMAGLLPPTIEEAFLGRAEVRETFVVPKVGTIAGCYMTEGMAKRNGRCRLVRDGVQIYDGNVASLRRFKDDVREVQSGFECGIGIEGYNDIKVGDAIELYALEEKPATL